MVFAEADFDCVEELGDLVLVACPSADGLLHSFVHCLHIPCPLESMESFHLLRLHFVF